MVDNYGSLSNLTETNGINSKNLTSDTTNYGSYSKESQSQKNSNSSRDSIYEYFIENYTSPYNISKDVYKHLLQEILYEQKNEYVLQLLLNEQILFWFPDYLNFYKQTSRKLMEYDSILPLEWKYFMAIMAASTLKCDYLVKSLEESFLECGGDINWLIDGLKVVPEKLQMIGKLNNILAYQPWRLSFFDFNILLSKINDSSLQWNIAELLLAFLI